MKYAYWLGQIPGIGNQKIAKLLDHFKTPQEIYLAKKEALAHVLTPKDVQKISSQRASWDVEKEFEEFQRKNIQFITILDEKYPQKLKDIFHPPYGLYVRGSLPSPHEITVGMVGARRCSEYGRKMALEIGEALGQAGVQVISGMAQGIDSYAHEGALNGGGKTYAVLGCGADICYPAKNEKLYKNIWRGGGILSEYSPGTPPESKLFPARNRIISGLSDYIIVVEAREKSGSLITADFALEQGRDIYAVPGRCKDALSGGCNRLIRQGAGIVLSTKELLEDFNLLTENTDAKQEKNNFLLEKDEMLLYSCLDLYPKGVEELMQKTHLDLLHVMELLSEMQRKGYVRETFKNHYIRNDS